MEKGTDWEIRLTNQLAKFYNKLKEKYILEENLQVVDYLSLLKEELVPALGCTEPIAIAYASAVARDVLKEFPKKMEIFVSGNVLKNVKSVIVPNSGGLRGVDSAGILGLVGGDSHLKFEVLQNVTKEDEMKTRELLDSNFCKVSHLETKEPLHILIKLEAGDRNCQVELRGSHTNIVKISSQGQVIFEREKLEEKENAKKTNLREIYDFALNVRLKDVEKLLESQIKCNTAIALEGLNNPYGQKIGKTLLAVYGNSVSVRARAMSAAGSDARMSGCSFPVVINSGSGNQGLTVSLPILEFAKEIGASKEGLFRSLVLSNLVAIHLKVGMGKLSAFCGVVSAAAAMAGGLAFLHGGDFKKIDNAISNTLANVSGIVCDGAKGSCAAKIASSVDAGILAFFMAMEDNAFKGGDGIIKSDLEDTISCITKMAREAMKETDNEILKIMFDSKN